MNPITDLTPAIIVTTHAVRRFRQRIGLTRSWSWIACSRWIERAVADSVCQVRLARGEIQVRVTLDQRCFWLAMVPDSKSSALVVRTVLPHAFAQRNLLYSDRRGAGRGL